MRQVADADAAHSTDQQLPVRVRFDLFQNKSLKRQE